MAKVWYPALPAGQTFLASQGGLSEAQMSCTRADSFSERLYTGCAVTDRLD